MNLANIDWDKVNGLVPAIVQDFKSSQVLMLGYMNKEALENTINSNFVHFYSRTKKRLWKKGETSGNVLLLNDDYTPMEFVVLVLESVFNKKQEEATQIMLHVHKNGIGVCGTFTYEVAESKCKSVIDLAKKHEHPLQCTMEKN